MKFARTVAIALAAIFPIAAASAAPDKPHADWTGTVASSAGGGHVIGNPEAPAKLVEFVSYTCPHCAHFHKESDAQLKLAYVRPGKVSVEIRHVVRDKVDLAATLLVNCGDPKNFIRNHNMMLQTQDKWLAVLGTASAAQRARWNAGDLGAQMRAVATDFGFYAMMDQRGYRRAAVDRCLSDQAMAKRLAAQTQAAVDAGVEGTPSFMLDGALLADAHDWPSISALLQAR